MFFYSPEKKDENGACTSRLGELSLGVRWCTILPPATNVLLPIFRLQPLLLVKRHNNRYDCPPIRNNSKISGKTANSESSAVLGSSCSPNTNEQNSNCSNNALDSRNKINGNFTKSSYSKTMNDTILNLHFVTTCLEYRAAPDRIPSPHLTLLSVLKKSFPLLSWHLPHEAIQRPTV